jgi:hypothetical protein
MVAITARGWFVGDEMLVTGVLFACEGVSDAGICRTVVEVMVIHWGVGSAACWWGFVDVSVIQ